MSGDLRPAADDGLVRAVEMVLTPLLFAAAGFGLDTWLGTLPWFTAVLGGVAFIGKSLAEWYRYAAHMRLHSEELAAGRQDTPRVLRTTDSPHADELAADAGLPTGVTLDTGDKGPAAGLA